MSWLNQARHIDAPKERSAAKYSNAYRHRIDLTKDEKDILIIKGSWSSQDGSVQNLPFKEVRKHYFYDPAGNNGRGFFRSFVCAKSLGHDSCVGCDKQYKENDKRVTLRNAKLWPVIHLDHYYRDESKMQYDEPAFFVQAETRSQEREFDNLETHTRVFGKPGFIELGRAHQEQLLDIFEKVTSSCVGCLEHDHETNGKIEVIAWDCPHCGARLEDIETTNLGRDAWRAFGHAPRTCGSCRHRGFPTEVVGCSQCPDAIRTEIYDVVLPLIKQGSGKDTSINLAFGQMPKYIDEYDLPSGAPLLDKLDGANRIFDRSIMDIYSPPNFDEIFAVEATREYQEGIFSR